MRRLSILFIVSTLFAVVNANAQKVVWGLKGGLEFSKIAGKSFSPSYSPSFEAGGYAAIKLDSTWGIQTEIVYSQQGEKINQSQLSTIYNSTPAANPSANNIATIGSVTVPILVTYKLNNFFSLMAGPAFTFNTYTNQNLFSRGERAFKETEVSLNAGANLNLGGVNFYVRYNHGLSDINLYNTGANIDSWKTRRMSFGLEVPIKSYK